MATLRTLGDVGAGQLPHPCGHGLFLRSGGLRLLELLSALAERLCRAAVGQKADVTQALQAVGDNMQQKAADALVRWQGHGLDAMTLASVAEGKTPLSVVDIDDTVIGDGHAVGVAPERGEHRPRPGHGLLGIDHPCLVIEGVDDALKALDGLQRGSWLSQREGIPAVVKGIEERMAKDPAQCLHGKQKAWVRGYPAGALVGQGAAWHQRVHVEMGLERLVPGVQEQDGAELAAQGVVAKLEQRLAGSAQQQGEQRAFVAEDQRVEGMGQGKDAVERGHLKEVGWSVCEPLLLAEALALGAVAVATRVVGIALEAALGALFGVSPELRRTTGHEVVQDLVVGWRHWGRRAVGLTIEAQDVGDFPPWCTLLCPACW